MSYNGPMACNRLAWLREYVASLKFISHLGWNDNNKRGHDLVHKELQTSQKAKPIADAVSVIVGEISEGRLGPEGSYGPNYGSFLKAKFTTSLVEPNDPDFGPDWKPAIDALQQVQSTIAISKCKNLIETEELTNKKKINKLWFSASVNLELYLYQSEMMKPKIGLFPIIKHTHQATPLLAFDNVNELIPPLQISVMLKGALVEVWFRVKHYHLTSDRTDSFSGLIKQIIVLHPPTPKLPSPYCNRQSKGPYRPRPSSPEPSHAELKQAADTFFPIPVGTSNTQQPQIEDNHTAVTCASMTAEGSQSGNATEPAVKKRRMERRESQAP
ncbi:hypothetical protein L208DRAFT_1378829 [Tricholoma matsutake]|nr:hypothetical protein L208DRAFT_1378829 [Tricholoma matsutake 945]